MNLQQLGWKTALPTTHVARVLLEHKHSYRVFDGEREYLAELTGKFRFQAIAREDYPAVGDWVVIQPLPNENKAMIHEICPRTSKFSRKVAGTTVEEQIVATNVDYVMIVMALNNDFNLRKLERYLLVAYESGAQPVVILTKKDLADDVLEKASSAEQAAIGVPVHAISSLQHDGLEQLTPYLTSGTTIALLGSSGVGKSTLLNALKGAEVQATSAAREGDDRGRHTTTHRELFFLDCGAMVIDTPGMRELQLWDGEQSFGETFRDIDALAQTCRFSDCRHEQEPGCAVQAAIADGTLSSERLNNWHKLQRELAYAERKQNAALAAAEKAKWKAISKQQKKMKR